MVGDKTADDFVSEALKRLCDGTRKYDASRSLLDNLNSVTDSLIWSDKKSSDRSGIIDYVEEKSEEGLSSDPISTALANDPPVSEKVVHDEILKAQRDYVKLIKDSFDGDKEMQDYIEALSEGYSKPAEIAELTGIPIDKVYELRRKLTKYAPTFFGVENYQEFALKIKGNQ
jgi:DNA-directed RNA polymerase specialized sigma24 family protein